MMVCADEWYDSLNDIKVFVNAGAADMVQIKAFVSRRVMAHVALATGPDQLLAVPGMGMDEGYTLTYNEMARALAIIGERRNR